MARVRHWNRATTAIMFPSWRSLARVPYAWWAMGLAIVVLVSLYHFSNTTPSRGLAIRGALIAAAAKIKLMPANEGADGIRTDLTPYFRGFDADIDASRAPTEVDITLRDLDGVTCLEAEDVARRVEGLVVVQLDGYGTAAACSKKNTMRWRLLP
jgi:hypothetical protein